MQPLAIPNRSIPVSADALLAASILHHARPGEPLRIYVDLEFEDDGPTAVSYRVEAERRGKWVRMSEGVADTADDAAANVARIADLAHAIDGYLAAWEAYHGCVPDDQSDWIQEVCIARARERGHTSYRLWQMTGELVSEDHIQKFLTRRSGMGSHKLQHVLDALGLTVAVAG